MTINETYDFLWQPKNIALRIKQLVIVKQELEACMLPSGISYEKDKVQTTPEDQMAKIGAEIYDIEQEIVALTEERKKAIIAIYQAVQSLEVEDEKTLIIGFFIARQRMRDLAPSISYSRSQGYEIMKRGIRNLSQKIGQIGREDVL